jgi:DNA-binding GntR family transcriptional regulator
VTSSSQPEHEAFVYSDSVKGATLGAQHRPLRDGVCDEIRERIVDGRYGAGMRLIEDRLAQSLGVSRNPVREALRVLESEGYVTMIPRRGAVVSSPTDEEVLEIIEVRAGLEELAWRLAASKATPADVARLTDLIAQLRDKADNKSAAAAVHKRFHTTVLDIARNPLLRGYMAPLDARMQWITHGVTYDEHHSITSHEELVAAIAVHDEAEVKRLAIEHIRSLHERFLQIRAASPKA